MAVQVLAAAARAGAQAMAKAGAQIAKKGVQAGAKAAKNAGKRAARKKAKDKLSSYDPTSKNIKLLKKHWMAIVLTLLFLMSIQAAVAFTVMISIISPVAFMTGSGTGHIYSLEEDAPLCPLIEADDDAIKRVNGEDGDYSAYLSEASKLSGVPKEVIAAIDWKVSKNSDDEDSTPSRLLTMGEDIQTANYVRNADGSIQRDRDGNVKKTLVDYEELSVGEMLDVSRNYHCTFIKKASDRWCFSAENNEEQDAFYKKENWLWGGYVADNIDNSELGVIGFYKNRIHGFLKICTWDDVREELDKEDQLGSIASGRGVPGQRDDNNMPILTPWLQGGNETWAGFDYGGGKMSGSGCAPTATAILLAWYGCDIDPWKAAQICINNSLDNVGGLGTGHGCYQKIAESCNMCAEPVSAPSGINEKLQSGEPVLVGTKAVTIRGGIVGHLVVMRGFDGQKYYYQDPMYLEPQEVDADSFVWGSGAFWFYKPSSGENCGG